MSDLPYQAEYAKSGRATCKGCKRKINKGILRIAVMALSAFFDGRQAHWHHEKCFFKKQRPTSVADIGGFNILKPSDQERIKQMLEKALIVMPEDKEERKSKKRTAKEDVWTALKDFIVEYAPSNRASCRYCDIKICKDEVRIAKTVYDTESGERYGGDQLWHHVQCFADVRGKLQYFAGGESLPGFKYLSKEDQTTVKDIIKPFDGNEIPLKKFKEAFKNEGTLTEEKEKEQKIQAQNTLFHKYRKDLRDLTKTDLEELLRENHQEIPVGKDGCLDRVADMMAFGALEPCIECKQGQLVLDTTGYKCTGNVSDWIKCSFVTENPKRVPMKVPETYKNGSIFKKYEPQIDLRLFGAASPLVDINNEPSSSIKKAIPSPLKNLPFFLYGNFKNKDELKKRILKLGGRVVSKLTDTIVAAVVVPNKETIDNMTQTMRQISRRGIEVLEDSFLDLIEKDGTIDKSIDIIRESNIAEWASDPATRLPDHILCGELNIQPVTSKIIDGTAVDPASNLERVAHVYEDTDKRMLYTVVLSQADVVTQKNSFYKMQVLESNNKKTYWLFQSWGRIGTHLDGKKLEHLNLDEAKQKFEDLYKEKTQNPWGHKEKFVKMPEKYYPLDLDYGSDEVTIKPLEVDETCNLPRSVQKLVITLFNVNYMKRTLSEFKLDTDKLPLGKLSKNLIKSGYEVLSELTKYIESGSTNQNQIIDATNRFFTLIPHNFGSSNAPLINNLELIKTKTAMLDSLLEIEIAYSLLKTKSEEASPIRAHYLKLKADIAPLPMKSREFDMIQKYVRNTHAATHSNYTLEIEQVFKVVRQGEDERYKPFKKLHNRRLLWHGSSTSNFAGIISQGLRIAPPEAPPSGYMFGKGIYFTDTVSISANYCCANKDNPIGLLLLCEVALGNMKECIRAEDEELPPNMHSVWGMGQTRPNPMQNVTLKDGLIVTLGTPVDHKYIAALLHNEFVVYNAAQVKVKYLLQMKFNYN